MPGPPSRTCRIPTSPQRQPPTPHLKLECSLIGHVGCPGAIDAASTLDVPAEVSDANDRNESVLSPLAGSARRVARGVDPRPFQAALDQVEANLLQAESQLSQAKAQVSASQAQVEQAIAQVAQYEAQVQKAQADQRRTELDVGRYTPLATRGSVSQQELDNAVQNNLANVASVAAARASVQNG